MLVLFLVWVQFAPAAGLFYFYYYVVVFLCYLCVEYFIDL